ncbi:MAG TPA: hypothetical protein VHX43_12140 [Xanthobacteraceae bacterium]|jgi:hypothetical protein|nr:hypothetical protein [Xanthobacteraceae bacterium]
MTSEPAGEDERHPPTIELKATEVPDPAQNPANDPAATAETSGGERSDSATPQGSGPTETASSSGRGSSPLIVHVISAVVGAVVAAAVVGGLWFSGIVPPRQETAPSSTAPSSTVPSSTAPLAATSREVQDLAARLDKLERAVRNAPTQQAATGGVAAVEAQTKSLGDSVAALNRRLDDVAGTSESAAKQAAAAASAAQTATTASDKAAQASQAAAQKNDLDALASRVTALESTIKGVAEIASHPAPSGDDPAARLMLAAQALHGAIERGAPYQSELAAVKSLGAQQSATVSLDPLAASGVPSAAALSQELTDLVPALQRAVEPSSGATTLLGRLEANARHLVQITPVEAPAGNAPSAVIDRIDTDASRADIAAALTDIAALPASAKPVVAQWAVKAKTRQAALQASRQISADALAAFSKPASQ